MEEEIGRLKEINKATRKGIKAISKRLRNYMDGLKRARMWQILGEMVKSKGNEKRRQNKPSKKKMVKSEKNKEWKQKKRKKKVEMKNIKQ